MKHSNRSGVTRRQAALGLLAAAAALAWAQEWVPTQIGK